MNVLSILILSSGFLIPAITSGCQKSTFGGETGKKNSGGAGQPVVADGAGKRDDLGEGVVKKDPGTSSDKNTDDVDGFATDQTSAIPEAPEPMYAATARALYSVNPSSGVATLIGQFNGSTQIWDIAIDGKGKMFAVDSNSLFAVDPLTAQLTWIMDHGVNPINALTVLSNGSMVLAGNGVYLIDNVTRSLRTLVPAGTHMSSGDIIALPDRKLYWSARSSRLWARDKGHAYPYPI